MRGNGQRRAFPDRIQRFDAEIVYSEIPHHAVAAASRRRRDRRALEDLAEVYGKTRIIPFHDRRRSKGRRIVAPAAQDDVRPFRKGFHDRTVPHLGNDVRAVFDLFFHHGFGHIGVTDD